MPTINTGPVQEIIKALRNSVPITSQLAVDKNGNPCIHISKFQPIGTLYPQITVDYAEGKSDSILPSTHDHLWIYGWCAESHKEPYKFLRNIYDTALALFNRKGSQFNNLDVPSDSGIRFCQFVKQSGDLSWDDSGRKYYFELVFKVVRSEGESFNPANAGDQPWT